MKISGLSDFKLGVCFLCYPCRLIFGTDRKSNLTSLKPFRPENLSKLQQILFETCVELFRPL